MSRVNRRFISCLVALGVMAGVALAASGSATASAPHYYDVQVKTNPIPGGTTATTVTVTFNDETAGRIVSADLFLPPVSVMTVTGASLPAGAGTAAAGNCSLGGLSGPCVRLRNLTVTTGGSVALSMTATTPPACTDVTAAFAVIATQSNGLNDKYGSPNPAVTGGDTLDTGHSMLSSTVHDTCHLAFDSQPANAVKNQVISNTVYTPGGPPVTVDVLDMNGLLVTSSTAPVTVSLGGNSSGATLGGTLTANAQGGVAKFGTLTVDTGQDNYSLGAANTSDAAHYAPGTSNTFNIAQLGTACTGASCTLTAPGTNGGTGKVVASPVTTGGTGELVESANIGGQALLVCTGPANYTNYDPNTYEVNTTGTTAFGKVFTITIVNPAGAPPFSRGDNNTGESGTDNDGDFDDVLATQRICFQAPYTFPPLGGGTAVSTGLLPPCPTSGTPTGPCDNRSADAIVQNNSATPPGYNIVLQAIIPPNALGDPRMH